MAWLGKSAAFAAKVNKQAPKTIVNRFKLKIEIMISPSLVKEIENQTWPRSRRTCLAMFI